jgi:hypothetical protein
MHNINRHTSPRSFIIPAEYHKICKEKNWYNLVESALNTQVQNGLHLRKKCSRQISCPVQNYKAYLKYTQHAKASSVTISRWTVPRLIYTNITVQQDIDRM